jgi:radical SAM superfamily enzyme YgiQ (UPF0313 family)
MPLTDDLLTSDPDIIGISIYIWNVDKSMEIISMLKGRKPGLIIIAGGPEVSYEPEYFLRRRTIDYIISGEGEFVLGELLHVIENNVSKEKVDIEGVSALGHISRKIAKANLDLVMKKERKRLLYRIGNDKAFLRQHHLTRSIIEKHTAIDQPDENHLLLTVFCNDGSRKNPLFIGYSY